MLSNNEVDDTEIHFGYMALANPGEGQMWHPSWQPQAMSYPGFLPYAQHYLQPYSTPSFGTLPNGLVYDSRQLEQTLLSDDSDTPRHPVAEQTSTEAHIEPRPSRPVLVKQIHVPSMPLYPNHTPPTLNSCICGTVGPIRNRGRKPHAVRLLAARVCGRAGRARCHLARSKTALPEGEIQPAVPARTSLSRLSRGGYLQPLDGLSGYGPSALPVVSALPPSVLLLPEGKRQALWLLRQLLRVQ